MAGFKKEEINSNTNTIIPIKLNESKYTKFFLIIGIFLVFLFLIILFYYIFFYPKECFTLDCYKESLIKCNRVSFIRDSPDAVWRYNVKSGSSSDNSCKVEVTLSILKRGSNDIEGIQGKSMLCDAMKNSQGLPEENLDLCNGRLKEEIQEIIIERMHNYLLKNLNQINEGFKGIGSISNSS